MAKKNSYISEETSKDTFWTFMANALAPQDEVIRRAERESHPKGPKAAHPEAHSNELDDKGQQRFFYSRPARHLGSI